MVSTGFTLVEEDDVAFTLSMCREVHRIYGGYQDGSLVANESLKDGLLITIEMLAALTNAIDGGMPSMRIAVAATQTREMLAVMFDEDPMQKPVADKLWGLRRPMVGPAARPVLSPVKGLVGGPVEGPVEGRLDGPGPGPGLGQGPVEGRPDGPGPVDGPVEGTVGGLVEEALPAHVLAALEAPEGPGPHAADRWSVAAVPPRSPLTAQFRHLSALFWDLGAISCPGGHRFAPRNQISAENRPSSVCRRPGSPARRVRADPI